MSDNSVVWIAQGFGLGRLPKAPGTFGSLGGLVWMAVLLATGNFWLYLTGAVMGALAAIWICGRAEKILAQKDPQSVVLDEIVAVPFCFAFLFFGMALVSREPGWATLLPGDMFDPRKSYWMITLGGFVAFRFFDIVKPWPVRGAQSLPGGWGIVVDDLLAAAYVNVFSPFLIFG
ncbi:MAG: phosphatidylglycerophosphatase A [Pedosphaera sp.]|nr:phosphatidylglycerophosphatase A [Pedosphaera sp.]